MDLGAWLQHRDDWGIRSVHFGLRLPDWGRRWVLATMVVPIMVIAAVLLGLSRRRIAISPAFLLPMLPALRVPMGAPVVVFVMVLAISVMIAVPVSMMVLIPVMIAVVVFGPVMIVPVLVVIGERRRNAQS